ncbi:rRNA-processing protein bfr2 [Onygenales sp. PD_40]|nr:rRNA-processing protein bfr2 [Onygenales sp. PD_40]KAK2781072.1 rRNA-processing protein bfr2 [Emmonsiellopsis sp. PD_33]KAK2786675.1 rRNA-processing protein bfr2 [Onygenales sp. PD_12]
MAKKSGQVKSLAEQIAELEDPTPKDFDPEDLSDRGEDSDDQSVGDDDKDASAGREHYVAVGKSKLRKPETVSLGREYAGSRVSRDALGAEDSDDPFRKGSSDEEDSEGSAGDLDDAEDGLELGEPGSDSEIDSEDALGESDVDKFKDFKFRGSKHSKLADSDADSDDLLDGPVSDGESDEELDNLSGSGEEDVFGDSDEDDEDLELEGSDVSGDEDEGEEDEEDDEDEDEGPSKGENGISDDRAELRRLMASDHKTVAASISQAAKTDAAKGGAVKRQRLAFDAILNARIKLQKGITGLNDIPTASDGENGATIDQDSIKSAEAAALTLWSTIEDLRHALADAQTNTASKKRKRTPLSSSTPSADIWSRMEEIEARSLPHRRAVLDKWSLKTRGSRATLPNARGKLMNHGATDQQTITAVLDAHIATEASDRPSKRVQTESAEHEIYDDSTFYQTLLRDLVEERMSATNALNGGNGIETLQMQLPTRLSLHPTTGMRKDKIKKIVDTKASKGRKMRYTVHEKLQNFMAPEERGSWNERAREEFFASLLGKSAREVLGEDEDEDLDMEDGEEDLEEGGLKLFRS